MGVCSDFLHTGKCQKGVYSRCPHSHDWSDVLKVDVCNNDLKGRCVHGIQCRHSHQSDPHRRQTAYRGQPTTRASNRRDSTAVSSKPADVNTCNYYLHTGKCAKFKYGECLYSHDPAVLSQVSSCRDDMNGVCERGTRCKYSHKTDPDHRQSALRSGPSRSFPVQPAASTRQGRRVTFSELPTAVSDVKAVAVDKTDDVAIDTDLRCRFCVKRGIDREACWLASHFWMGLDMDKVLVGTDVVVENGMLVLRHEGLRKDTGRVVDSEYKLPEDLFEREAVISDLIFKEFSRIRPDCSGVGWGHECVTVENFWDSECQSTIAKLRHVAVG